MHIAHAANLKKSACKSIFVTTPIKVGVVDIHSYTIGELRIYFGRRPYRFVVCSCEIVYIYSDYLLECLHALTYGADPEAEVGGVS